MYYRSQGYGYPQNMRIPINYGGNAFSKSEDINKEKDNAKSTVSFDESQNNIEQTIEQTIEEKIEQAVEYKKISDYQEFAPTLLTDNTKSEAAPTSIFKGFGNNSFFGGRIGSEELLILALVFLLSDTDGNNDIIWLLLLLLFIK